MLQTLQSIKLGYFTAYCVFFYHILILFIITIYSISFNWHVTYRKLYEEAKESKNTRQKGESRNTEQSQEPKYIQMVCEGGQNDWKTQFTFSGFPTTFFLVKQLTVV